MNEEYLKGLYAANGGTATFGDYDKFLNLMENNENYRKDVYNHLGGAQKLGDYDAYSSSLKKKEPTQASSGNGSNQTQQSSGSQPSQGKSVMEQAAEIVSGPKMSGTPQTPEQVAKSVEFAKSQQKKEPVKPKPAGPLNAPKASEPGEKVFSSERQLLDYMEELKANSSTESQAELKRIADDYTGIVSDINTNGSWSYESKVGEPGITPAGKVAQPIKPTFQTAKYKLDQINAGKLDPKTVDPNGRWEEKTEYDAGSTYFDAAKGGTVTTQPGMKTKKVWVPSGEFAKEVAKEGGEFLQNKAAEMKVQTNIVERASNQKNWDTYRAVSQVDVTTPERELADLEEQKKNGQVDEQYYATKKEELENRKKYSYKNLEATYLSVLEKTDPDKYKEYSERYSEVMNNLNKKGFETWEDANNFLIKNGKQKVIFEGGEDLEDLIGIDQSDAEFLRNIRSAAIGSSYAPIDRTIEYASDRQVRQYMTDIQPVLNDVKQFSSDVDALRNAFNSGAITQEEYKSRAEQLKLKEQELTTRAQQIQKESGVTDFDLNRYSKEGEVQQNLAINNSNFSPLYEFEKQKERNIADRQKWVSENPILGSLAYGTKDAWKSFTDMVVMETAKSIKPISEVLEVGDGYGWADRLYYTTETAQNNRDYLYGYSGMDIDGDGKVDDLPEFAKLTQTLGQGIGSVGAFALPGAAAGKLFSGAGKMATLGRFGVNTTGAFLMMEGQAYQEALRAGLSQDDAAESATIIASLQAIAEQAVPDIKYFDNVATRAGMIASYKAGIRGNALLRQGLGKIEELAKNTTKGGMQEFGEEYFGALSTDLGKDISNELYNRVTTFNMDGTRPATYKTNPYQDLYQAKNLTDNGVAGFITGGGMRFFGGLRPMSQTQMQNLSYMGKNANDILRIIEQTQSNGVNPGDATFKEIEKQLTGISETWNALQSMPGFTELTSANQDVVMALTYRKNQLQENARKIGVTTDAVKQSIQQYDQEINDYLTGKKDYGATKPVMYNDDNLMAMGVRNVAVNPDGTYVIQPREDLDLDAAEVTKKAEEYIKTSLKDTAFADSFYHPKTDRDALSKQKTSEVPVQPEAGVGEEVAQGKPTAEPQVTTEEGKKEEIANPLKDVESTANALSEISKDKFSKGDMEQTPTARDVDYGNLTWQQSGLSSFNEGSDGKTYITDKNGALYEISKTKLSANNIFRVKVKDLKGNEVGIFEFKKDSDGKFSSEESYTSKKGLGIAAAAYDFASKDGELIKPSKMLKEDGVRFWSKSIAEAYHKAKEDGSNPELVNEVERLLVAKKEEVKPTTTEQAPETEAPVVETPATEAKPAAGVRAVKPKVFDAARKNTLLAKFKNDSGKRALVSSIDRAANAIRQAYGNVPIYVHETTADMQAATAITGGATMSRTGAGTFQYDADGNVIAVHVNLAKAGIDTAPHEFTHLILMDAFGDNPKLFKEFKDRIIKALSASRVAELEAFANQYTDENVKPEEFLAQLAGVMTANREKLTPTMAQKIMNLINEFISRITKGKLIPFKANAQTKDLMDFFNTVSSAMATGKGGEAIKAAAEKAGSKFETAKKPTEEAGARDRSKEQIKSSDAKAIKPENFAYDNEWDVVANGEKIGRTYYDRSIKSWVNADFYKGSVSASKDTFLWVYGDILGETKQEAINELVRRYNEGATEKDIIEQQTPVIKEATREDIQGIYDDIKQSGMPVYQSPLQQRTFIVNDNVFVEMYPFGGSVHLSSISSMEKGKGNASSVMRQITNSADNRGLKMDLGAKAFSEGGLKTSQLIDFYTKFGFTVDPEGMFAGDSLEEIKEYVDDNPRESVDMIRLPKVKSKEQIVGQAGVETAADDIAMQDLDVAKNMEAANRAAQDIKSATGWEVGADGQWRYEYPDVELNDDIADDFDVLFYLQENAKREGVRVRPNEMYPPAPLNRILDFGKLEKAYPYIDEIAFAVNPNLGGAAAVFRPDRNLIEFGPDAIKNEGVEGFRRTLIHEIQHYVQEQEGFEGGSNLTYEADKFSKSQDVYKIPGLQLNGAANVGEAVKNGTKEILDMMDNGITVTEIMEGNYDKNKYSGNPEAILKHTANEGDAEGLDEMAATDLEGAKKIVENAINRNAIADIAYNEYRAQAGEVEARNAEERSRIPYAERLYGKTIESTEDVARRNQILDSAKKAVSAMDVIAKKRGVSKAAEIKAQREILGENYDKAKQISDNFEDIAEKLGITKICGL